MTSAHAEIPQNQQGNAGHTGVASPAVDGVDGHALSEAVNAAFDATISSLKELVAIPGIAWASFDPAELDRSAEAVAAMVRAAGMQDIRILRSAKADGTNGVPPSSPVAKPGTASPPSCCTRTTMSSRRETAHCGIRNRLSLRSVTDAFTAGERRMTRPASWPIWLRMQLQ